MIIFRRKNIKLSLEQKILEKCYVSKPSHVTWHTVENRAVILNVKNASYCTAEGTALRIWELIDKGITVSELVETISNEYTKNAEVVKKDLAEILASMKKEGIIELIPKEGLNAEER